MSAWTVAEEDLYIVNTLKRYDPKIESLIERCHHARLHETATQTVRAFPWLLNMTLFDLDLPILCWSATSSKCSFLSLFVNYAPTDL